MTRGWNEGGCTATGGGGTGPYPIKFVRDSSSSNQYMANDDDKISTRFVPEIVPFDGNIVLATFSNERTGVDVEYQLLSAPMGTANNSAVTIMLWQILNKRAVCECFNIAVNACDKLALFQKDLGTNPKDPRVTLWIVPSNLDCIPGSDNLSAHFPSTGGTTST